MPNGYVSQIQINGGDVQNIGSCAYAVCDTADDVSVKVVTLPGFVLKDGATIHVKFTYRNTAFNPELNVNGTGAKSILLNTNLDFNSSISLSSQYNVDQLWLAGAIVTLTYDGMNWVVNNPSRITTPFAYNLGTGGTLEPDSYMILADIEWERCTSSSNVTARVFPFRICMSTMVDGVYRDRSAIMEVFVGGCYSKKDYVDIMIHDESEYHVNDDNVFRSLIDSIFIYFEYEVASGNVIGKRTGHLLGKIPSRWSTFQLVPLTNMSVASANPDNTHHFLRFDIANSRSSFEPTAGYETSIPSDNTLPVTVGVHKYLIKARLKPFNIGQLSSDGSTAGQYLKSNGSGNAPSWETMDSAPTASSTKAVTSGGVMTALDNRLPRKVFQIKGKSASSNTNRVLKIKYNGSHEFELHMRGWNYIGETHIIYFSSQDTTNYASSGAITHIGNAIAVSDISILFKDRTLYIVNNAASDYYTTLIFTVNEVYITESFLVNLDSVPEDAVTITPKSVITDALGDSRYMPIRFGGSTPSYTTGDYTQCYDNTMHTSVRLRRFYVHTSLSNHFDNIDRKSGWTINTENVPSSVSLFDGSMTGWNSPAASTVTEQNPTVVEITYNNNIDATDVLLLRLHAHRDYIRTVSFKIEVKWTNNNWYEVGTFTEVKIPFCCTLFNSSIKEATGVSGSYIYIRGLRITFTYASSDYWLSEVELLSFRDMARANESVRAIGTRGGSIYGKLNLMYDAGAIASGETGAVTGGTVYTALQGKQDSTTITTNTSTPADNDTVIMQASGTTDTTTFLRRTMSKIWDYIKSKADSVYNAKLTGSVGSSTHPIYQNDGVLTECNVADNYIVWSDNAKTSAVSYPLINLMLKSGVINCIEGILHTNIKIEHSSDGVVWTEMTDKGVKGQLCGGVTSISIGGSSTGATNASRTRITVYANDQYGTGTTRLYAEIRCIGVYFETRGASNNIIEIWGGKNEVYTKLGEYSISGNAGWNSYPFNGRLSGSSSYWNSIRLVLRMDGALSNNNSPLIHCLRLLASNVWTGDSWQGGQAPRMPVLLDSDGNRYYMLRGSLKLRASSGSIADGDAYLVTGNTVYQALLNKQDSLTLPLSISNGGTGATDVKSARMNLLSDATVAETDVSDSNYFAFRYQTPSNDNGAIYYKGASKVWNYINSKITAGTGLTKTDGTINHSNSITAQTSDLGSYQRIPVIQYDAQGHITKGEYVSIFNNERTSTIKVGYISNGSTGGTGWYKVGQIDYWTGTYNRFTVLISMNGTSANSHDYGLLRIRGVNAATAGTVTGIHVQWIMKTPETSNGFTTDCIRVTKSETGTSSGATLFIYMKLPVNSLSYNFLVLNEAQTGTNAKAFRISFANSTAKETTEPSPTYVSTMAPLILGNQSNCLEITDSNWQSYLTASNGSTSFVNCDILTIPEGTTQIFFNTTNVADIALVRGEGSIGRFPRNGVRITIAGNWKPQENGGYSGGLADGRFSAWLYHVRYGVSSNNTMSGQLNQIFEDYMYFNGVWYSKGY